MHSKKNLNERDWCISTTFHWEWAEWESKPFKKKSWAKEKERETLTIIWGVGPRPCMKPISMPPLELLSYLDQYTPPPFVTLTVLNGVLSLTEEKTWVNITLSSKWVSRTPVLRRAITSVCVITRQCFAKWRQHLNRISKWQIFAVYLTESTCNLEETWGKKIVLSRMVDTSDWMTIIEAKAEDWVTDRECLYLGSQ